MDSEQYWKNRALRVKDQALTAAEDYEKGANKRFAPIQKDIEEQIEQWTKRYATASGMTIEDAQASLTPAEMTGWRQSLDEWEKMAVSPEYEAKYKALMNAEYAKSKINRLELLKSQVQHTMAQYASPEADNMQNMLTATYANTYYRSVHNIQNQKMQVSGNFARFNEDQLQAAVGQRWAGGDFSSRIWGNMVEKWPEQLNKTIFRGAAMGASVDDMVKEAKLTFRNAKQYELHRLITTEAGHVAESATLKAYQESGVERYEYMATLESHTCEICRALDGKVFDVEKQIAGENYPLIHPNCRCTTAPWLPEVQMLNNERWSRNPETTKVEMANNVSFGEWAKQVGLETGPLKPGTKLKTIYSKAAKGAALFVDTVQIPDKITPAGGGNVGDKGNVTDEDPSYSDYTTRNGWDDVMF
jgi:phage putative head morphogenesis protein, SPP1 gp7 family